MFENDYILRLIEQMGDFYRKLLALRDEGKLEECHKEIDGQYRRLGVSRTLVRALPPAELTALLGRRDASFAQRCVLLARVAQADGRVCLAEGKTQTAGDLYRTAVGVLGEAADEAEPDEEKEILLRRQEVEYDIANLPESPQGL